MESLKEKFISTQQVWLSTTKELDCKEEKYSSVEMKLNSLVEESNSFKLSFETFKQEIALMLSDDYLKVESSEIELKDKIKLLMLSSKHRGLVILGVYIF